LLKKYIFLPDIFFYTEKYLKKARIIKNKMNLKIFKSGVYSIRCFLAAAAISAFCPSAANVSLLYSEGSKPNLNIGTVIDFKSIGMPYSLAKKIIIERDRKGYFSNWEEVSAIPGVSPYLGSIREKFDISTIVEEDKISFEKSTWVNFVQAGLMPDVADKITYYKLKMQEQSIPIRDWTGIEKLVGKDVVKILKEIFFLAGEDSKIRIDLMVGK